MKPPPLASDAHPGFIRVDGVTILLQSQSDRLHYRFPAIGHLTDAAHYRAGPQPNLPFIANPCANALDGKPWVTLHIDCSRVIVCVFWKNAIVVENHYAERC